MGEFTNSEINENEITGDSIESPSEVPAQEVTEQAHEQLQPDTNEGMDDSVEDNEDMSIENDSDDPKTDEEFEGGEYKELDNSSDELMLDDDTVDTADENIENDSDDPKMDKEIEDENLENDSDNPKMDEDIENGEDTDIDDSSEKPVPDDGVEDNEDENLENDSDDPKVDEDIEDGEDADIDDSSEKPVPDDSVEDNEDENLENDSDDPKMDEDIKDDENTDIDDSSDESMLDDGVEDNNTDTTPVDEKTEDSENEELSNTPDESKTDGNVENNIDADAERKKTMDKTPINGGHWSEPEKRGDSKWMPDNPDVKESLAKYGKDGVDYKDGYPDLSPFSAWNTELNPDEYNLKDSKQFQMCNDNMSGYFEEAADGIMDNEYDDPLDYPEYRDLLMDTFKCSPDDLEDIQISLDNCETPSGYTWHHGVNPGQMDLVPTDIHQSARHRGGRSIWGGGAENR